MNKQDKINKLCKELSEFNMDSLNSSFFSFEKEHKELFENYRGQSIFSKIESLFGNTIKATLKESRLDFGLIFFESLQELAEKEGFEIRLGISKPIYYFILD